MLLLPSGILALASVVGALDVSSLNASVDGRLHQNYPLALPCFSGYNGRPVARDSGHCAVIQDNYTSPSLRAAVPNGYMNNQDEMCSSNPHDQCLLDNNDPSNLSVIKNRTCGQGNVPDYYLDVHDANDVIQALHFANNTGTPLVIKNTGHDYHGRSSQKGSLALWTRNLKTLKYDASFIPAGCNTTAINNTVTTGAGVNFDEVYRFSHRHGMTFIGGYSDSVGVSGGWLQAGGHSVLSPVYGLGIDRVVQFKLVTPDGRLRIANACQNPDLFWALRGGGGGTFGVVLESTHRVEPNMPITTASIKFPETKSNVLPFMDIVVNNSLRWAHEGWGGHIKGNSLINVSPLVSVEQAQQSLAQVAAYARSQNGTVSIKQYPSWMAVYEALVISNSVSVGNTHFAATRLIPKSIFASADGRQRLMKFFSYLVSQGRDPYIPVVPPFLYNATPGSTSATPAWREAVWSLGAGTAWAWNSSLPERHSKIDTMNHMTSLLEELTPGSGAYTNEANPFTEDWQEAWWGRENYGKLLAIKHKYDPHGVLSCFKCVGWREKESDKSCFSAFV